MSKLPVLSDLIPDTQVATVQQELSPILAEAKAIAVTDQASYQDALRIGELCAKRSKAVIDMWKDERDQAHALHKAIVAKIKQFTDIYDEAKKIVSGKAYAWERAERERLAIEAEKKRIDMPQGIKGASHREKWVFEIIGEVPREFMTPDLVKIGQYARTVWKNEIKLPWVRVWDEGTTAFRTKG